MQININNILVFYFCLYKFILTEATSMTLPLLVSPSVWRLTFTCYWWNDNFYVVFSLIIDNSTSLFISNLLSYPLLCSSWTGCSWWNIWKENISFWIFFSWKALWDIQWCQCATYVNTILYLNSNNIQKSIKPWLWLHIKWVLASDEALFL